MKLPGSILFVVFLAGFAFVAETAHADEPSISISIAAPVIGPGDPERTILVEHESHMHVVITNISEKMQRIVDKSNSVGDHALSFEITNAAGKKYTVHTLTRQYTKNMLHWWELQPGEHLVLDVELLDPAWQPAFPHPPRYGDSETVTMSAIFELKVEEVGTNKEGLWTGRVASKPEKYVFSSRVSDSR